MKKILLLTVPLALGAATVNADMMYENQTYTNASVYENYGGQTAYDSNPSYSNAATGGYSSTAYATNLSLGAGSFARDLPNYDGSTNADSSFTTYFNITGTGSFSIPVALDGQLLTSADGSAGFYFSSNAFNADGCYECMGSNMKGRGGDGLDSVNFNASFGGFDLSFDVDASDTLDFYAEAGDVIGISFYLSTWASYYGDDMGMNSLQAENFVPEYVAFADFLNTATLDLGGNTGTGNLAPVPVPAAVWLLGSGLIGVFGFSRRKANA